MPLWEFIDTRGIHCPGLVDGGCTSEAGLVHFFFSSPHSPLICDEWTRQALRQKAVAETDREENRLREENTRTTAASHGSPLEPRYEMKPVLEAKKNPLARSGVGSPVPVLGAEWAR